MHIHVSHILCMHVHAYMYVHTYMCVYIHRHTVPCVCESMITYAHTTCSHTTHALHVCACLHACTHTYTYGSPPHTPVSLASGRDTLQALFLIHTSSLLTWTLTRTNQNIAEVTKGT